LEFFFGGETFHGGPDAAPDPVVAEDLASGGEEVVVGGPTGASAVLGASYDSPA
jgi:hypothetical protein